MPPTKGAATVTTAEAAGGMAVVRVATTRAAARVVARAAVVPSVAKKAAREANGSREAVALVDGWAG
jgi:hypothetical protein